MNRHKLVFGEMDWIDPAQDGDSLRALATTIRTVKCGEFLD